jgi:hypothetical protein
MHGLQNIKVVKQVEEAAINSAVVCNDLECEKCRISVGSFVILYSLHYMANTTAKLHGLSEKYVY